VNLLEKRGLATLLTVIILIALGAAKFPIYIAMVFIFATAVGTVLLCCSDKKNKEIP